MTIRLKPAGKSILIGGAAGGMISLIPIINLLNLFFMSWMGFGGGLCIYVYVHLLERENGKPGITVPDALLAGAASGALGCVIFAAVTLIVLAGIPAGKIERLIALIQHFLPAGGDNGDIAPAMEGRDLEILFLTVIGAMFFFSIIMGALGGIISRGLFKFKGKENG